jgi:hypothetical protein
MRFWDAQGAVAKAFYFLIFSQQDGSLESAELFTAFGSRALTRQGLRARLDYYEEM